MILIRTTLRFLCLVALTWCTLTHVGRARADVVSVSVAEVAATQTEVGEAAVTKMMLSWAAEAKGDPAMFEKHLLEKVLAKPFPGVIGPSLWGQTGAMASRTYILDGHHRASALQRVLYQDYKTLPPEIQKVMPQKMQRAWQTNPAMLFKVNVEKTYSRVSEMVTDFARSGRGQLPSTIRKDPEFVRALAAAQKKQPSPKQVRVLISGYGQLAKNLGELKNSPLRAAVGNAFYESGIDSVNMVNYAEFITAERIEKQLAVQGIVVTNENAISPEVSRAIRGILLSDDTHDEFLRSLDRPTFDDENLSMIEKAEQKFRAENPNLVAAQKRAPAKVPTPAPAPMAGPTSASVLLTEEKFYSVAEPIRSITGADIGHHRPLKIESPPELYHWVSKDSLKRLATDTNQFSSAPMKTLGTDSYQALLTVGAPAFRDQPGLYTWHNPVGGSVGGSAEIYGNHEAVMALKMRPNLRVGLVVTSGNPPRPSADLSSPALRDLYDVILHVNGSEIQGKFGAGYIEWVIVNPNAIEAVTADPNVIVKAMEPYKKALAKFSAANIHTNLPPLEYIAGPQHNPLATYAIREPRIERMEASVLVNKAELPASVRSGWAKIGGNAKKSCPEAFAAVLSP